MQRQEEQEEQKKQQQKQKQQKKKKKQTRGTSTSHTNRGAALNVHSSWIPSVSTSLGGGLCTMRRRSSISSRHAL